MAELKTGDLAITLVGRCTGRLDLPAGSVVRVTDTDPDGKKHPTFSKSPFCVRYLIPAGGAILYQHDQVGGFWLARHELVSIHDVMANGQLALAGAATPASTLHADFLQQMVATAIARSSRSGTTEVLHSVDRTGSELGSDLLHQRLCAQCFRWAWADLAGGISEYWSGEGAPRWRIRLVPGIAMRRLNMGDSAVVVASGPDHLELRPRLGSVVVIQRRDELNTFAFVDTGGHLWRSNELEPAFHTCATPAAELCAVPLAGEAGVAFRFRSDSTIPADIQKQVCDAIARSEQSGESAVLHESPDDRCGILREALRTAAWEWDGEPTWGAGEAVYWSGSRTRGGPPRWRVRLLPPKAVLPVAEGASR